MADITYSEAVERVARAIHASRDGAHDYRRYKSDPRIAEAYRKDAAAALSTILDILREPTDEMRRQGNVALGLESPPRPSHVFRAMLAASPLHEEKA